MKIVVSFLNNDNCSLVVTSRCGKRLTGILSLMIMEGVLF